MKEYNQLYLYYEVYLTFVYFMNLTSRNQKKYKGISRFFN